MQWVSMWFDHILSEFEAGTSNFYMVIHVEKRHKCLLVRSVPYRGFSGHIQSILELGHWRSEGERNLNSAHFSHEILVDGGCVSLDYVLLKTKIYEDAILLRCSFHLYIYVTFTSQSKSQSKSSQYMTSSTKILVYSQINIFPAEINIFPQIHVSEHKCV